MGAERLIPLVLVALLAAGCQGSGNADTPTTTGSAAAVVEWVNDGDTLTLTNGGKVRLLQVDAPELTTDCYGRAALEALIDLAPKGTRVTLASDPKLDDRDRFGRLLRYVFVRGENVNVELVREGAASPYFFRKERGVHARELLDAVDEARDARRGYWGSCPRAELNTGLGSVTGKR
ncbi:MAG TPA: thermonuclease family protein [Gaiella sp.]